MGTRKVNLNEEVTVTLTEYGAEVYRRYLKDIALELRPEEVKAGNKLKLQLWEVISIFEVGIGIGNAVVFEENVIEFHRAVPQFDKLAVMELAEVCRKYGIVIKHSQRRHDHIDIIIGDNTYTSVMLFKEGLMAAVKSEDFKVNL